MRFHVTTDLDQESGNGYMFECETDKGPRAAGDLFWGDGLSCYSYFGAADDPRTHIGHPIKLLIYRGDCPEDDWTPCLEIERSLIGASMADDEPDEMDKEDEEPAAAPEYWWLSVNP